MGGESTRNRRTAEVAPPDMGRGTGRPDALRLALYVKGFPPRETGGPVEVAAHLSQELLRIPAVQLTLIVQTDSTEEEIRGIAGGGDRLDVILLPYFPTTRELRALRPVLRAFARATVVHFNEFPVRHLPLVLWAKLRGVPVVFSLHGLLSREIGTFLGPAYPLTLEGGGGAVRFRPPRAGAYLLQRIYRALRGSWTAIVAPSRTLRDDAIRIEGFPGDRMVVIPHGVDEPDSSAVPLEAHEGPIRILFVGKLDPIKGPDLLLDALERLAADQAPVDASFVGGGSLEADLRERAHGIAGSRITFYGVRRGQDLKALYTTSDIVVVPSRYETFSLVVLEAMAAGRPIVASRVGGIPEILQERRNAILVSPDGQALAAGLRTLIDDPKLRQSMREANLADSRDRSWSRVVTRYWDLYDRVRAQAQHGVAQARSAGAPDELEDPAKQPPETTQP